MGEEKKVDSGLYEGCVCLWDMGLVLALGIVCRFPNFNNFVWKRRTVQPTSHIRSSFSLFIEDLSDSEDGQLSSAVCHP